MVGRSWSSSIALGCLCVLWIAEYRIAVARAPQVKDEITEADIRAKTGEVPGTREDADAVVKAVGETVTNRDAAALHRLLDEHRLVNRILVGLDVKDAARAEFEKGVRSGGSLSNLTREIMAAVEGGGDYRFFRHVTKGNETRPLFRLILPNFGGVNYHELIIARDATGEPRITDIYIHITGELISQSVRRLLLPAFAAENNGLLARLTGREAALVRNFSTIEQINKHKEAKDFQEAYRLLTTLPQQLQKDKTILVLKLVIAQQLGVEEYVKVLRELEVSFPNDPARDFRSIDLYATQGNHEKVVEAVDRLIAANGDPYLYFLKLDSLVSLGRTRDARAAVKSARTAGVDTLDTHWMELGFFMSTKDHVSTAKMLDTISNKFGVEFSDLSQVAEYADFVASAEGKAWMRTHATAGVR